MSLDLSLEYVTVTIVRPRNEIFLNDQQSTPRTPILEYAPSSKRHGVFIGPLQYMVVPFLAKHSRQKFCLGLGLHCDVQSVWISL